jgi:ATP-dependent Clp protease adapter protein ClpS
MAPRVVLPSLIRLQLNANLIIWVKDASGPREGLCPPELLIRTPTTPSFCPMLQTSGVTKGGAYAQGRYLAQERKRAKELLRALRHNDGEAIGRFRSHHPRLAGAVDSAVRMADFSLDAQLGVAREYEFASWPALRAAMEQAAGRAPASEHTIIIEDDYPASMEFFVDILKETFQKNETDAVQIMLDLRRDGIGVCAAYDRFEEAEAKMVEAQELARRHGHELWVACMFGSGAATRVKQSNKFRLEREFDYSHAKHVRFDETTMSVDLVDGRVLGVPLVWFPELVSFSPDERRRVAITKQGRQLSWEFGLEVSVSGLLLGPRGQKMLQPRTIAEHRAMLARYSRQYAPFDWAEAQNALGGALLYQAMGDDVLFDGDGDAAKLEEAVRAHRAALEEHTRAQAARMGQDTERSW